MVARVWTARALPAMAPRYADHLKNRVLPELNQVRGYSGAMLLERPAPDGIEIVVITYWQSIDSIKGFAGEDPERAVVAAEAAAMLTRFDERVRHYEVSLTDQSER